MLRRPLIAGDRHIHRVLYSYLKPEPARVHPEATVRPWSTCQVVGDALSFAAALGYVYVSPTSLLLKLEC